MQMRGRPAWYRPDTGLAARMLFTMFLLGAVYVVFAGVLRYALHLDWIVLLVIAAVIAFAQLFFADKIALASMGAKIVSEQEMPDLHDLIGRLAAQADLPKPRVAFVNTSIPNAFATGRDKNHAVVAVTSALYNNLSRPELEAVLAHELTHIINRDMLVMTIATFFSMVASLIVQNFFWLGYGMGGGYGRRSNNDGEGNLMLVLLASLVTYALSFLLIRALSRYRELAADRGAALITGAPEHLATALISIDNLIHGPGARIPQRDFRQAQAASALFFAPATRGDTLQQLFSTHPSLQERLDQLQRMQAQMERGQGGYRSTF
ncbi:MAG TPA: zinc metalloprotease HtpX [Ktedonobacterales bacterium]|nr:zinc metalloprotease HtpX [Ktedonobacterales bacterium]